MERLDAEYRERIDSQKVAIWVEAQRRAAREEEERDRVMVMRRAEMKSLEMTEVERIKAERRSKAEEAARMEAERRDDEEAARVIAERQAATKEA